MAFVPTTARFPQRQQQLVVWLYFPLSHHEVIRCVLIRYREGYSIKSRKPVIVVITNTPFDTYANKYRYTRHMADFVPLGNTSNHQIRDINIIVFVVTPLSNSSMVTQIQVSRSYISVRVLI